MTMKTESEISIGWYGRAVKNRLRIVSMYMRSSLQHGESFQTAGIVIGSSISLPPRNSSSFRDVAKRAKVSAASVSRLARGNPNVHTDIRARVLKAARELGVDIEDRTQARTS